GNFQAQLFAAAYNVDVTGMPAGYFLKAVQVGGREMPDALLDLSSGPGRIDIILSPNAGTITGQVQNSRGDGASSIQVTVSPANGSLRRDMNKSVTTDANGSFTLSGLPQGDYKLFAWQDVEPNAWMDREYRQPFENSGVAARVSDSSTPNVA